jgi:D-beta-D-heptose 7-phosphate kinase/D-beta-D-heptose 1-phosphate adenosyltransferase
MNLSESVRVDLSVAPARIVVMGDVMLDQYIDGHSTRLSPEAPVPVVRVTSGESRLGGAANVAAGLAQLGVDVHLLGVVGRDDDAQSLRRLLAESTECQSTLVEDVERPTTSKTRVRDGGRHLVRIDREADDPLRAQPAAELATAFVEAASTADVIVVSDYAKGVVTPDLLRRAFESGKRVLVDPKHQDIERFRGATVVAPNRREAQQAWRGEDAGLPTHPRDLVSHLGRRLPGTAIVVTCGSDGIYWAAESEEGHEPARARSVADVTGSGDSVMVGLALGMLTGRPLADGVALASMAAAAAVESAGTATPSWAEIDAFAMTT